MPGCRDCEPSLKRGSTVRRRGCWQRAHCGCRQRPWRPLPSTRPGTISPVLHHRRTRGLRRHAAMQFGLPGGAAFRRRSAGGASSASRAMASKLFAAPVTLATGAGTNHGVVRCSRRNVTASSRVLGVGGGCGR